MAWLDDGCYRIHRAGDCMALIRARDIERAPRHWALVGSRLAGKSTFLTAMSKTILVVDTEGRGREIEGVNNCEVFFPDVPDRQDPLAMSQVIAPRCAGYSGCRYSIDRH